MNKDNTITVSGKNFEVRIEELEDFFSNCQKALGTYSAADLVCKIEEAQDLLVSNAKEDDIMKSVQQSYVLLKELKLLFGFGFMVEKR